jgi:hypothetical protein
MVSTWYGISIKACRLALPCTSHCCQVSHRTASRAYTDLADPSERSKSHSINDKPIQNEVNTPHYLVPRVYPSVGPGLEEVWAEATKRHSNCPSLRFDTKNSCTQPFHVFTTLYGYASLLARQVSKLLLLDQMSGIRLSRQGKTSRILIAFERLTHAGLSRPFVGFGTDLSADARADSDKLTQIWTDLEVIPSFLEIRSRSSVDG